MDIQHMAGKAKAAGIRLAATDAAVRNSALSAIATSLWENRSDIAAANQRDLDKARTESLAAPLLKRLKFDESKILETCKGLESLRQLPDPVGNIVKALELDKGLELFKVSCPIGVIGVIFESRPDALVQISSLCLKSGNAVLLKGGSEAARTNRILADLISKAAQKAGLPDNWIGLMETRSHVQEMLGLDHSIDLIIPRGSNAFVKHIMDNTRIPVLGHADGICHVYVDRDADLEMAIRITVDSKCQYVSVCNAAETLLVHKGRGPGFSAGGPGGTGCTQGRNPGVPANSRLHTCHSGHRNRLANRIPGLYPVHQGRRYPGAGYPAHQPLWIRSHRCYRQSE